MTRAARKSGLFLFMFAVLFFSLPVFAADFYWENPKIITSADSRFPVALNGKNKSFLIWEEIDSSKKQFYLSCRIFSSLTDFTDNLRFAGPYSYAGDEVPESFSACIDSFGNVCIAVMAGPSFIETLYSEDDGKSFKSASLQTPSVMVAPRVFYSENSHFVMFTSSGQNDSFSIYYATSLDGFSWSKFEPFEPSVNFRNPFLPHLISFGTTDVVAFQSQYTTSSSNRISYQIYLTHTLPSGKWSEPVLITGSDSFSKKTSKEFYSFQNQRPFLFSKDSKLFVFWERTETANASVCFADVTNLVNGFGKISDSAVIAESGNSFRAIPFIFNGDLCVTWFDARRGKEGVYFAVKKGSYWEESSLAVDSFSNQFSYPLILNDDYSFETLCFSYQQSVNSKNSVAFLSPDRTVDVPEIIPLSYKKGKSSASSNVRYQIKFPKDSSNIAGYSYTWSHDFAVEPENSIQKFASSDKLELKANSGGGDYYLCVRIQDYAGNWSKTQTEIYNLDLTPPLAPEITLTNVDSYGFVNSNTFRMNWKKSESEDTSYYVYRLDYAGSVPKNICVSKNHPMQLSKNQVMNIKSSLEERYSSSLSRKRKMTQGSQTSARNSRMYTNLENGVYVFSVAAVDEVGNLGEPSSCLVILNKFQPETLITSIEKSNTESSTVLAISGTGFSYDGTVSEIYIDSDGVEPYDLILKKENGDFKVASDSKINSINIGNVLDEGVYKIGLFHTDRGIYFSKQAVKIERNGNLKIESDFVLPKKVDIVFIKGRALNSLILLSVFLLLGTLFMFCLQNIAVTGFETNLTYKEIKSFWKGDKMPLKKKNHKTRHQSSLRTKLMGFIYLLIVGIVVAVTFENGYNSIELQSQTMASSLQNRAEVLLESLCSGVKNFLPANNLLELTSLPSQKDAMSEVKYVTIIGQNVQSNSAEDLNYVWATNDGDISSKIDSYTLSYGESKLTDDVITEITSFYAELDLQIAQKEKEVSDNIESLTKQAEFLYQSQNPDDTIMADQISEALIEMRNSLDRDLISYSDSQIGSWPHFNTQSLDRSVTDYIFYKPVLYRKGTADNYIHALVYLELTTESLLESIEKEVRHILIFGIIVAVAALHAGLLFAFLFASLIVRPLKKLEKHVLLVGHTKNKVLLKGKSISIKSKDEVGRLCSAVNEMTRELVANAEEEELTMDGKAVQKAFLPLLDASFNSKQTVAEYSDSKVQCYGYYEGESGVSGDYFDYKKLDDTWYGIIKCDASGHGIPAAIIMTVVATIFRRYFNGWKYEKQGTKLNVLVEQINDFIENLGLKGKFATLIVCLLNSKTGELYMCNAGDNLVHIFKDSTKTLETLTLKSAPTAGVFTSDLVQMRGGFAVEKTILQKGDVLLLYTDGIEESTRRLRDSSYNVIQENVQVKKINPQTHQEEIELKEEDAKEEFGFERIKNIIESVFNHRKYVLQKAQNPDVAEVLEFDFSETSASLQDAVLALASCEKVFRLYKNENASENAYVRVDKKIDEFLNKYFNMYDRYSSKKSESPDFQNYIDYDTVSEDEQSDDLTLLAIKLM